MVIGSNNSLTYLKASNIWLKFRHLFTKCQEKPYDEQYNYWGVRFFDFRLFIHNNSLMVKNNVYKYPLSSLYRIMDFFNSRNDVVLRITLDASASDAKKHNYQDIENKFNSTCKILESIYGNIVFCGGTRKFDNKQVYNFEKKESNYGDMEIISPAEWSLIYRFITKWMPRFIGKLNSKYIEKFKDKHVFLVLNYVNRR
jgi:hypothetical protein